MKKNSVFEIVLDDGSDIKVLAIISSKGLAYQSQKLFEEIYAGAGKILVIDSNKRIKNYNRAEFYSNL